MDFERLDELARKYMLDRKTHRAREIGAAYFHGARVGRSAARLRAMVTEDGSWDERLKCAGLFHDIGKGFPHHARIGALLLKEILKEEMPREDLEAVCRLVECHQDRGPGAGERTVWEKILQDADLLDHYGAQGLWMSCTYYAYEGQKGMHEAAQFYESEYPGQIKKHRKLLNFPASRKIFDEKTAFELAVAKRMRIEGQGEYTREEP